MIENKVEALNNIITRDIVKVTVILEEKSPRRMIYVMLNAEFLIKVCKTVI